MKSDSLNDKSKAIQLSMFDDDYDNLLDTLIQHIPTSEFEEVEYKSGAGGFPNELWKTYSAFANTNSGLIVIGVKEKNNLFTVEGLTDEQINKYKQQFWNECNNPNKVNRNLLSNDDIKVVKWNGKQVLVIKVPFASRTERPVYLTKNPFSNTYKRNHEGVQHLSPDELTVLAFCQIEGAISNQRLQYALNMHSADIAKLLKKLVEEHYLESNNNGRWTIYKLSQKVATSKVDTSKKVATYYGKPLKKDKLQQIIMEFCKNNYVTKEELATHLGKSLNYVRNKIIPEMIKEKKLEKKYPFTDNHPEQAYKTTKEYAK